MKIRVQHRDGRIEILTIKGHLVVDEDERILSRITTVDGPRFDLYFTPDGFYDGWGGAVFCDEEAADAALDAMEQKREFVD